MISSCFLSWGDMSILISSWLSTSTYLSLGLCLWAVILCGVGMGIHNAHNATHLLITHYSPRQDQFCWCHFSISNFGIFVKIFFRTKNLFMPKHDNIIIDSQNNEKNCMRIYIYSFDWAAFGGFMHITSSHSALKKGGQFEKKSSSVWYIFPWKIFNGGWAIQDPLCWLIH